MNNILLYLLVGLIAGQIASYLVSGHGFGALGNIIIGIIGAFVGGFVFELLDIHAYGFVGSIVTSVAGAMVFLFVVRMISRTNNRSLIK